ncbi:hypothetical protein ACFL4D_02745 [Candidatus Margulisiibacteriota bacterium]
MKKWIKDILIIAGLIFISVFFYFLHYLLFHDFHHISIYFIGDLGFLGVEALIVYFVIDRLLSAREKETTRKKLNMLAGVFFQDAGIKVFNHILSMIQDDNIIEDCFAIQESWKLKDFAKAIKQVPGHSCKLEYNAEHVQEIKDMLEEKKSLIIRLMENPGINEHNIFSDMLISLFHLTEELMRRDSLTGNTDEDKQHLLNDMKRVFQYMGQLWIEYMLHLKKHYAYLYLYNIKNRQLTV